MEGVELASTPPLAPPPPPPPRTATPAALRLADFVVVVFAFFLLGFAWLSSAANAALIAAEWGYGRASIQVAATKEFAVAASVLLGLFVHAVAVILVIQCWRDASRRTEAREEPVHGAVVVSFVVLFMFLAMSVLMHVISWAQGARDDRASSLILETVFFISSVLFCVVTIPLLIIRAVVASKTDRHETVMS
ncbi:unnamed protein product [Urochloa humidicola]